MTRVADIPFVKGHATENDFVVLPDLDGKLELSAEQHTNGPKINNKHHPT